MELRRTYLFGYNAVQFCLWARVLFTIGWYAIGTLLKAKELFTLESGFRSYIPYAHQGQTLAWLEVLHAVTGLAGGGVSAAFVQCLGRYVVLVYVVEPIRVMHSAWVTVLMIFAWALADVIRYAFYMRAGVGDQWPALLWLRYSLFIVLYPVGIVTEWLVYYFTLGHVDETGMYAVRMPNAWNFAFDFGIWNRCVLVMYLYFGPFMLMYMVQQRKKKLGTT